MKKIGTFRSRGSMRFLFSSVIVVIVAILFLTELNELNDYVFIISFSYYLLVVLYYSIKD